MILARRIGLLSLVFGLTQAAAVFAQTAVDPNEPLPAGHPSVAAGTNSGADDGAPADQPQIPAREPPQDRISPASDLRPGTIEVHVHDVAEAPVPSSPVKVTISKQDVAEGDSHSERIATTDVTGVATFDGLPIGTAYTFRVTVNRGAGTFSSDSLRLTETSGQRMLLHVYDSTRDLRQALVGVRGVIFVQPREDVFHMEGNFQVINIGTNAWVPDHVSFALPSGSKAFRPSDAMSDTRAEQTPSGAVELVGTYAPGQHDVGFQFTLDNTHDRRRTFHITLPPHVAELRVVAEGARGMLLTADGFPEAEPMQGQDGSRLLVTGRHLVRGDPALESVEITLDNLPVPSLGRWYAVGIALSFAAAGLFEATRGGDRKNRRTADLEERLKAEDLVLDELVLLEKLREAKSIGPRAYQEARVELLEALTRLEARGTATAKPS